MHTDCRESDTRSDYSQSDETAEQVRVSFEGDHTVTSNNECTTLKSDRQTSVKLSSMTLRRPCKAHDLQEDGKSLRRPCKAHDLQEDRKSNTGASSSSSSIVVGDAYDFGEPDWEDCDEDQSNAHTQDYVNDDQSNAHTQDYDDQSNAHTQQSSTPPYASISIAAWRTADGDGDGGLGIHRQQRRMRREHFSFKHRLLSIAEDAEFVNRYCSHVCMRVSTVRDISKIALEDVTCIFCLLSIDIYLCVLLSL